jgi:hypothetical protein
VKTKKTRQTDLSSVAVLARNSAKAANKAASKTVPAKTATATSSTAKSTGGGPEQDSRLRQFLVGFAGQKKIDAIKTVERIMSLQKTRNIRYLTAKQAKTVKKLTEVSVTEASTRGQLTDILMEVRNHQLALRGSIDLLVPYLTATYSATFSQRARADRVEATYQLWPEVVRYLQDLDRVENLIEQVVKDIDQSAYTLQRLTTLLGYSRSPVSHL